MLSPNPEDFTLLLEVFREGLKRGLVSKNDVTGWADDIITNSEEPDYFFIELSLGSVKDLPGIIDQYASYTNNVLIVRVLFGLLHKQIVNDAGNISSEYAAKLIGSLWSFNELTTFELNNIYSFDEYEIYFTSDPMELRVEIFWFLCTYEEFNLQNYDQWPAINAKAEEVLKQKEIEQQAAHEAFVKNWKKQQRRKKLKKQLLKGLFVLIFLAAIVVADGILTFERQSGIAYALLVGILFSFLRLRRRISKRKW